MVLGWVREVRQRTSEVDESFGPLRQTCQLLNKVSGFVQCMLYIRLSNLLSLQHPITLARALLVVLNPRVFSANRVYLGFIVSSCSNDPLRLPLQCPRKI